jgi:hypothetical protein
MNSPLQFARRFLVTGVAWCVVVAGAVACGVQVGAPWSWAAWAGISALFCVVGALLIKSQPMGRGTIAGRIGYQVVHFGFKAGQGSLTAAAAISWTVWLVVGSATVWVSQGPWDLLRLAMAAAWVMDTLAFFYIWGIALRNRPRSGQPDSPPWRLPRPLLKLSAGLAGLIIVSGWLWFMMGTPAARLSAVLLAGGPILIVGGGYGLVALVFLTAGRNVRWN